MTTPARVAVTIVTERVEQLGRAASAAGSAVSELNYDGMTPRTTASSATMTALASCVTPATRTTHGVGVRFSDCGRTVTAAAAELSSTDRRGSVLVGGLF